MTISLSPFTGVKPDFGAIRANQLSNGTWKHDYSDQKIKITGYSKDENGICTWREKWKGGKHNRGGKVSVPSHNKLPYHK